MAEPFDQPISRRQWDDVRRALRDAGDRFADLLDTVPDPDARATGTWTVADTAAHVAAVALLDTALLAPESPSPVPDLPERLPRLTVDGINGFNDVALGAFQERRVKELADEVREHVTTLLDATADRDPDDVVTWVGGACPPLGGLLAHLVNELLLHGHDVAAAAKRPWTIPPGDAAHFFEQFMVGMARHGLGRLLDGGGAPSARRVAVEFRSAHTTPVALVLRDGRVTAERPGGGADVRLSFDPAAFTMMMFGRISKPRAVLTRKVRVGGPRPWLLPVFLRTVRVPS